MARLRSGVDPDHAREVLGDLVREVGNVRGLGVGAITPPDRLAFRDRYVDWVRQAEARQRPLYADDDYLVGLHTARYTSLLSANDDTPRLSGLINDEIEYQEQRLRDLANSPLDNVDAAARQPDSGEDRNGDAGDPPYSVLLTERVRWAIGHLAARRVHPFFLAYLHLRARAIETGSESGIRPKWSQIGALMRMPGGPPGKPHYRPLVQRGGPDSHWLNENLAGSYSPSSLREEPRRVVNVSGSAFALKQGHAQLALEHLLFGERLSALALSVYLYRDFGFHSEGLGLGPRSVVEVFKQEFGFSQDAPSDDDFDVLFSIETPDVDGEWFESLSTPQRDEQDEPSLFGLEKEM